MKNRFLALLVAAASLFSSNTFAWEGMPTPMLHVEGRFLKNPDGQNVTLRGGWMQPTESWFSGGGKWYSNPSDWTNQNNVGGMLNFLKDAATVMSDTSPRYGRNHGWYASYVRVNTDAIGGWTQEAGLVNQAQFNAWIQNFVVPYAAHLKSRGLYLVLCATGPINTPNNGTRNAGRTEQARLRTFWSTVANAPGVKNADNIMFELMNEPVDIESSPGNGDWGHGQAKYFSAFRDWIQPVINDVRNTGANNVIWVPTIEWQGSPQQHVQFPFTCTNCGIAAHYYPAYGGCYDDTRCHNLLWDNSYKPAAEKWPMIITENFWFREDSANGLSLGSTDKYGKTLKANIDAAGNVSYVIGFLGDLLGNLNDAKPATANLSPKDGSQAAFEWWYQSNHEQSNSNSCTPTAITPYVQVNGGRWQKTASVTVDAGAKVKFGPQPKYGGAWSWNGGGTSGAAREQTIQPTTSITATATYENSCHATSTQKFTIAVNGSGSNNGGSANGGSSNGGGGADKVVHMVKRNASGFAIDGNNGAASGQEVYLWTSDANNINQTWIEIDRGQGFYSYKKANTDYCIDGGMDGASQQPIILWLCDANNQNQHWQKVDVGSGNYRLEKRNAPGFSIDGRNGGADAQGLYLWPSDSNNQNQHWTFSAASVNGGGNGGSPTPNPNPNPKPNPNPTATSGCGQNPGIASGRRSITVNGDHREYIIDLPNNYDKNKPYRLIFAWHWLGGAAGAVAPGYYGLRDQSQGQAIFVAPDRYNTNGHDDSGWPNTNGRDMNFLRAMLKEIKGALCVDSSRVFSTGWSYGGMMSLAVGREMAGEIRAVAPMSGALFTPFKDSGKPVAAWIAHGYYDNFVDFNTVGKAARDYYVKANHCSNQTKPIGPDECVEYQGCDAGAPVVWCQFAGPHGTPGFGPQASWQFFNRF